MLVIQLSYSDSRMPVKSLYYFSMSPLCIQNMCATQIMTKSKSLRTGLSSQVAH